MAQPPFQTDVVQIEPGALGTRRVERNASTGGLLFTDAVVTGGVTLSQLAGFDLGAVFLVAQSGAGAAYTTIQSALDAVPSTSSPSSPNMVLVAPGTYTERLTVEKDGVCIAALGGGRVVIEAPDALGPTMEIKEAVTTVPTWCCLVGLTLVNAYGGQACLALTGGVGSTVGSVEISLLGCNLEATTVGAYQIAADTVNNVRVEGGTWVGSVASTSSLINQCASFFFRGVDELKAMQFVYDSGQPQPATFGSTYRVSGSVISGNVLSSLTGQGSLALEGCLSVGNVTAGGDRPLTIDGCNIGDLAVNGTVAASLRASSRGAVGGSGTVSEPVQRGSAVFTAVSTVAVSFPVDHPDDSYTVALEYEVNALAVTKTKTASGFTIEFPSGAQTTTVNYAVLRD